MNLSGITLYIIMIERNKIDMNIIGKYHVWRGTFLHVPILTLFASSLIRVSLVLCIPFQIIHFFTVIFNLIIIRPSPHSE